MGKICEKRKYLIPANATVSGRNISSVILNMRFFLKMRIKSSKAYINRKKLDAVIKTIEIDQYADGSFAALDVR